MPVSTSKIGGREVPPIRPLHVEPGYVTSIRTVTFGDAANIAAWTTRGLPVPVDLARALPTLFARLISDEVLRGVVVEYFTDSSRPLLAAFGLAAFISDEFTTGYLASPHPYPELHLLEQARQSGRNGNFLGYDEIARANAGDGLVLTPLLWLQRSEDPHAPETRALLQASQETFIQIHRGYRLSRILKETTADRATGYIAGGFREKHRLPSGTPLRTGGHSEQERVVLEVTRSDIENSLPGSAMSHLFAHQMPRCGFTHSEKQVLERAVNHLIDDDIAASLAITPAAVALRWRSAYTRVAERIPSVFGGELNSFDATRGKEKRRRVIAFIGSHPEEIRPYPPT